MEVAFLDVLDSKNKNILDFFLEMSYYSCTALQ